LTVLHSLRRLEVPQQRALVSRGNPRIRKLGAKVEDVNVE